LATGIPKNQNSKNSGRNSDFPFCFPVNENMHQKLEDATKELSHTNKIDKNVFLIGRDY